MASNYFLLFKTAQAEFRAWDNLETTLKSNVYPNIELTRGRRVPKATEGIPESEWATTPGIYNFDRTLEISREAFAGSERVGIDLTREASLQCAEIAEISKSENGYANWLRLLDIEKRHYRSIIPTIISNPSAEESEADYKDNILLQTSALSNEFDGCQYRASPLIDPDFIYDLRLIKNIINNSIDNGKFFTVILDYEFIRPGTGIIHAASALGFIEKIIEEIPRARIVLLSTSFPKSIEELGNPDSDAFPREEEFLFSEARRLAPANADLWYGDYGSINPTRNDAIIARGGWRPRIDFPTSKGRTYYFREKREKDSRGQVKSYGYHYVSVARKVISDPRFEELSNSWGVKQITEAANGNPPGKSPSFWISVRMEIHIQQQIRRLQSA